MCQNIELFLSGSILVFRLLVNIIFLAYFALLRLVSIIIVLYSFIVLLQYILNIINKKKYIYIYIILSHIFYLKYFRKCFIFRSQQKSINCI
uniref:Uncharacterized protein n=1 Tax=Glossina morsitans morsitans TaxID=37546 RepID=A0ABK9NGD3_GLOMM